MLTTLGGISIQVSEVCKQVMFLGEFLLFFFCFLYVFYLSRLVFSFISCLRKVYKCQHFVSPLKDDSNMRSKEKIRVVK